jgi:succinyl-CoA synthetase alpha subunit
MSALKQATIRVVAIIAEGVPESDAKQLISYARANNKVRTISYMNYYFQICVFIMGSHHKAPRIRKKINQSRSISL